MATNSTENLIQQHGNLVPTGRLLDGQPRTILFDAAKCIGCRHCVEACKDWNELTARLYTIHHQLDDDRAAGAGRARPDLGAR